MIYLRLLFAAPTTIKFIRFLEFSVSNGVIDNSMRRDNFWMLSVVFFRVLTVKFFASIANGKFLFGFFSSIGFIRILRAFLSTRIAKMADTIFEVGQGFRFFASGTFFHRGIICH